MYNYLYFCVNIIIILYLCTEFYDHSYMNYLLKPTRYILLLVALFSALAIESSEYRAYKIRSNNGLNSTITRDITQDADGYMWFATIHGLCRYDGYVMKQVITQNDVKQGIIPDIRTISVHRWGKQFIWTVLRGNFFCCYDLKRNRFMTYSPDQNKSNVYEYGCFDNSKEAWLYNGKGDCRRVTYDGNSLKVDDHKACTDSHDRVNFISQGANGRMWIGRKHGLTLSINGKLTVMPTIKADVRHVVTVGGVEFFVCYDATILKYANGKVMQVAKGSASIGGVTGAVAHGKCIIITTQSNTYEYRLSTGALSQSSDITFSQAQIEYDSDGNALIWNAKGDIAYLNKATQRLSCTNIADGTPYGDKVMESPRIATTRRGDVFIVTDGQGLYIYTPSTGSVRHHLQKSGTESPINTNYLLAVYCDRNDNVWISLEDIGVSCVSPLRSNATFYAVNDNTSFENSDLHANTVRMLRRVSDGTIFVASLTDKLFTFDGTHLTPLANPWGSILAVTLDKNKVRWMGTRKGVVVGDRLYSHDPHDAASVGSNKISDVCMDRQGRMWLAAYFSGLDLAVPDAQKGYVFRHFLSGNAQQREARTIRLDHKGYMWLGTGDGCYVFNPDKLIKDKNAYLHLHTNENSAMDEVHSLYEDNKHRMWVAITGTGVACYDNSGNTPKLIRCYTTADGLSDIAVQSVILDSTGRICVGTNRGLSVFDEKSQKFLNFRYSNKARGDIFVENAVCNLSDGRLAIGTKEGLLTIMPGLKLKGNNGNHILTITDILVNGVPMEDIASLSDVSISDEKVTFDYDQNSLTFNFSDFNFDDNHGSRYTYMLEGYDKEWAPLTHSNTVTYRNLAPGKYILKIRSYDDNGSLNELTTQKTIVINSPIWATWYAYLLYILLLGAIIYFVYRHFKETYELNNKIKVEHQLSEYKMQFFTNISHEFRTPLTIIRSAMERIHKVDTLPADLKQPLGNMQKSTQRLMRLISRLMDFRKLQENRLTLSVEPTDVVKFAREIYLNFRDVAENKDINFIFNTFSNSYIMPVDQYKLDSILYNLISNALKYTPRKGEVIVTLFQDETTGKVGVEVKDSGMGVSEDVRDNLFNRFMQGNPSFDSVGIGLYVSYGLAQMHHGSLSYADNPSGGSIFTLLLPPTDKAYAQSEKKQNVSNTIVRDEDEEDDAMWLAKYKEMTPAPLNDRTVLIVEDDNDVCELLRQELSPFFATIVANDGEEAWNSLSEKKPDIIVSDVAMPNMNGFELTKRIKSDDNYLDIPVVLLTSKNREENRVRGYDVGADDYIPKPFSMRMLVSRLTQLLNQREKLKKAFSSVEASEPVVTVVKEERDKRFMDKLDTWIVSHLSDPSLNVDELARSLGYGRSTFYRKVSDMVGMTPNAYIRKFRMDKSKDLLTNSNLTISEIAYKTGFSSAFYFSKCFKETYGMSPSQFRNGKGES